jgi:aminoglycoside phosphotransferase (APT) family kinase protein
MTEPANDKQFERWLQSMEPVSTLLRAWPLTGGVSAQVTALEVARADGDVLKMIVRQHGVADFTRNPRIAADEFTLLQRLHAAGLATPTPYYLDQSGDIFATPIVVMEYIEGVPADRLSDDHVRQFAAHLSHLHALDPSKLNVAFLPQQVDIIAEQLRERPPMDERRVWEVLRAAWPIAQHNPSVLLHGDYWPGNTLWRDGRLVGIIDWEDAALGDPLADLANSRLELLWAAGVGAMEQFTRQYQSLASVDLTNLPYWDLCAALRPAKNMAAWGLDDHGERSMREGLRWFIRQAIAKLPVA